MKKMLCSIIFIILLIPSLVYAKGEFDYKNVCQKLNDTEYLKKIKPYLFLASNKEYIETNKPDEEKLKKVLQCWDAIYYAQLKSYKDGHKIEYYYDRARITAKYSEEDSLKYWKKYLYITFKTCDKIRNTNNSTTIYIELIDNAINTLNKHIVIPEDFNGKNTIKEIEAWKENIYNDEVLKKEFDINDNVFEKSK